MTTTIARPIAEWLDPALIWLTPPPGSMSFRGHSGVDSRLSYIVIMTRMTGDGAWWVSLVLGSTVETGPVMPKLILNMWEV